MTPPPGWYRDLSAPHLERWWDGTAWTEHRRAPEIPGPPVPALPSAGGASGRAKAVALISASVVLVVAIVTGTVVLGRDGGGVNPIADPTLPTPTAEAPTGEAPAGETASPSTSEPSADDADLVVDQLNGITLPLLDGWVRPRHIAEADVLMTTDGAYDCPADAGACHHGLVVSRTVTGHDEKSPEALARADIPDAAGDAYDRDRIGRRPFGGMESHKLVGSGPVAVAGRAGYYVRWRVSTAKGPGGYVQSLAFPCGAGPESRVIVRYVLDAGEDGPPLSDMDRFTKGIKVIADEVGGGGVGSSIGPRG
ncbi:DUF2510 domain-containing protein [Streptomyces blattellae]|uniref:DUF2510 domain-containing protein n=1 Tax=Streptomyces blattellae TaxID=2569855 RepID=UPI0012B711F7|nr:DUF2510 domain-containing protein [Streptomyces blattellae]